MIDLAISFARLFGALALVALNGFFVASEFAFVRIRPSSVDRLADEGRTGATVLKEAMGNLDDYLAVTQLGITISSLGLGWLGEPAIASLLEPVLGSMLPASTVHLLAIAIGFFIITFLHVVFGELAPKTFAIAKTEQIALSVALPMKLFYYVLYPGIVVFNGTANAFTRLFGVPPASESEETYTEEELRNVLSRSGREGDIDVAEVEMIHRVFDLDDITVREIMVPAPDVASLSAEDDVATIQRTIVEVGHTRYPVLTADETDEIVGFVDTKDVVQILGRGDDERAQTAEEIARDLPVIPETARITDLLTRFQSEGRQMAAVVDEWGVFEGIVTVEDVVEEIVGDLYDQFDQYEPAIHEREDGTYVVNGGLTVSTLNDRLDTSLEADEVETVGGMILERLGRVPDPGDSIEADGVTLTAEEVDVNRITSVVVDTGTSTDTTE